jgi:peptide methionine sulfoxide reductase msrA/msrB
MWEKSMQDKSSTLTPKILEIVQNQGTEIPGTGKYCTTKQKGTYLCRRCGLPLFSSKTKFDSGTGWPSFDASCSKNVTQVLDSDQRRTEILCSRCSAHLGHVFKGENMTAKNERYCVNSLSLDFVKEDSVQDTQEAIFAGGCFWGLGYLLAKVPGVLKIEVGYIGGHVENPTYKMICQGNTGHLEAARIIFDSQKTNFEEIAKTFFEIHDPTQKNGQGPDIGSQYQSAVFYLDEEQKQITFSLIEILKNKGFDVATQVLKSAAFWSAEDCHQAYYETNGGEPYCHFYTKRF